MSGTNFSNSIALGYNTAIAASDQVRIGNSSVTSIGGQVGWTTLSDGRFKKDVNEKIPGLDFIIKLRPVSYHLDMDAIASFLQTPDSLRLKKSESARGKILQTGFIAQEVEKAAQDVGYNFSGVDKPKNENDYYGLRYDEFVVPLVKAVQEQQRMIEKLSAKVDSLQSNSKLANTQGQSKTVVLTGMDNAYLGQNFPNPFSEETRIDYYIPEALFCANGTCRIIFYDQLGRTIQETAIEKSGFGTINVSTKNLAEGVYIYRLFVNGEVIDMKKMVMNK